MKRSGGHRIPGLNCCGQGRMCYRWSKRYCWGGRRWRCYVLLGHAYKNPHSSFSPPKSVRESLAFLQKSWIFQVKTAPRLFPPHPSPSCVEEGGFFLLLWISQKGPVAPEENWDFLQLAEMAIIARSVPSFPSCGSTWALSAFGMGTRLVTLPWPDFSLVF